MRAFSPANEDTHVTLDSLPMHRQFAFWAVFDGHNGKEAAELVPTKHMLNMCILTHSIRIAHNGMIYALGSVQTACHTF